MPKIITPEFIGSFVALAEPRGIKGDPSSTPKYQMTIVLPKADKFWLTIEKEVADFAKGKWGKVPPKLKSPIKDGDDSGYDNMEGCFTMGASNTRRPGIVDASLSPIMDGDELYSGAVYRASIRAYAWDHPTGGRGVSFSLDNVMKVKDGDPLDGSSAAASDFSGFAVSGGAEADSLLA